MKQKDNQCKQLSKFEACNKIYCLTNMSMTKVRSYFASSSTINTGGVNFRERLVVSGGGYSRSHLKHQTGGGFSTRHNKDADSIGLCNCPLCSRMENISYEGTSSSTSSGEDEGIGDPEEEGSNPDADLNSGGQVIPVLL